MTFGDTGLASLFVLQDFDRPEDPDRLLTHSNGARRIERVWVEASAELGDLLVQLGGTRCGVAETPDGRTGVRYGIDGGEVIVVEPQTAQPRVIGVGLTGGAGPPDDALPWDAHGIWIGIDPGL